MSKLKQIPKTIEVGVYWYEDDNGVIQFDYDEMLNEFETKFSDLEKTNQDE